MGSHRLRVMIVSTLFYICLLRYSLASSCEKTVITQHPSEVEAKEGDTVKFTCIIEEKYNVSTLFVKKDQYNVMIRNVSDYSDREENIVFSGTNHKFTISVTVRNKTDSNTYYCEAGLYGQPSRICGAGTFIKVPVTETESTNGYVIAAVIVGALILVVIVVCVYRRMRQQ
ncbi:immunoglobulin kappa light chain-like [Hyla sarda]|uniref:immunoglobulin kappa light chain-like n=1 Tax=Hyla sarda TaxID=327740 RepID=UPI0024C32920|nr:immunoglobulin kappa light chain-like [Hyla sarda]XP_056405848.1 immunoglobulin kappa light chain-like [Hyla sarda]